MDFQNFLLSSLFFISFIYVALVLQCRRRKLPPGPMGLPLVGNLFDIGPKPHESLAELAKTYGPLMTIRLGSITVVVVSSAEAARDVLRKNDEAFSGRPVPDASTSQLNYHLSMVWLPTGDNWRMMRRAMHMHLTHPQKQDTLVGHRRRATAEMIQHVVEVSRIGTGEAVNINALAFTTALNGMANACFSVNVAEYTSEEAQGFSNAVKTVMAVVGQFNIADVFPCLKPLDPQGLRRRGRVAYGWMEGVVDDLVTRRLRKGSDDQSTNKLAATAEHLDLLDSLLDEHSRQGSEFSCEHIKVLLLDLILGGTETNSNTTEWAMTELLVHPEKMATLRQEITGIVGEKGMIQEADILELPYLQAVVKETMRLHLVVPLLVPHKTEKQVELNGFVIPENTRTLVNAWAIARDPVNWEKPTSFIPERFLHGSPDDQLNFRGQNFKFIPFGSGRRMCPGISIAQSFVSLMVASLVYHFDWMLPHGLAPENLDMDDVFGLTLQRASPLFAVPKLISTGTHVYSPTFSK